MRATLIAAPGGGPDWPVWGQVMFLVVWAIAGVFIVGGLIRRRRNQR
ncbi:hypothetical protein [Streptomyces sp. NPDC029674]